MTPSADRVALVTGASSGIGAAFARRLAKDGYRVVLVARREERLRALAEELAEVGAGAEVLAADLATDDGLLRVLRRVEAEPQLALLVNNAGFAYLGPFEEEPPEKIDAALRVLVGATTRLTRAALPGFRARGGGAVINVSSRAGFAARPELATYGAAKAAVNRFTVALAAELEGSAIRVVAVCPGNVWTELFQVAGLEKGAIRSAMQPEEVVDAALDALERRQVVVVPGESARDRLLRRVLPAGLLRKLAGVFSRLSG